MENIYLTEEQARLVLMIDSGMPASGWERLLPRRNHIHPMLIPPEAKVDRAVEHFKEMGEKDVNGQFTLVLATGAELCFRHRFFHEADGIVLGTYTHDDAELKTYRPALRNPEDETYGSMDKE